MGSIPSSPVPTRTPSRKRKTWGYSSPNDASTSHGLRRQGQPHYSLKQGLVPAHGQGFEPSRTPMSPYDYDMGTGYRYDQGPDYTPVIPLEFQHLVPSIRRQYSKPRPVIPVLQSQAPNFTQEPQAPVIPPMFEDVATPRPHAPTPRPGAGVPLQQPNAPVQDAEPQLQTASRELSSTKRRRSRKRGSLVLEVTMGDREHTSVERIRIGSQATQRSSQPSTMVDPHESFSQDQRHRASAEHQHAPSLVANVGGHPVMNDDHEFPSAEGQPGSVGEDDHEEESDVAPLASGSGRRINRVQTPFHRPRSLESSIDDTSPVPSRFSDLSALPAIPTPVTPGQYYNPQTHPPSVNQGSIRSHVRSASSYTTDRDISATPTTSPTTPTSNAHTTHTALSRSSYQGYQPEPNPLPAPPVDIFELPEWQHLRYLLEIPPKRDNIGQVNLAIGETSPAHFVSTTSQAPKQKKGLFRAFSLKKSSPSPPPPTRNGSVRSQATPHQSTGEAAVALLSRLAPYVVVNTTPQPHSTEPIGYQSPQPLATPQVPVPNPNPPPGAASAPSLQPVPAVSGVFPHLPGPSFPVPENTGSYYNHPLAGPSNHPSSVPLAQTQTRAQPGGRAPPQPHQPKRILFDVHSEYSYFLMHSPHPVVYEDQTYPTAAHLLEALKFFPDYPEIAERIRLTKEHRDVQMISAENAALVNPAYTAAVVENIHKVVSLKFRQHADLRYNLCDLDDDTQIIYNDPSDSFWGIGFDGNGMNELGMVLQRVMKELKPKKPSGPSRQGF